MSEHERIFNHLIEDWQHVAGHFHRHDRPGPYHQDQEPSPRTGGLVISLEELGTRLEEGLGNIKGWGADVEPHLADLKAIAQNPVVKAWMAAALPPEAELFVADFITKLAAMVPARSAPVAAVADDAGMVQPAAA
jgi:hypothetical protein